MALINLGNFSTIGGKQVSSSGLSSGLDTKSLVDSLVTAKQVPIKKLEDSVELEGNKLSAYSEMKSLLATFKSALDGLRNPPGLLLSSSTNLFQSRQAFISSNTSIAGNTYVGVNVKSGALLDNYDITIDHLAKAHTQLSGAFSSKTASVVNAAGDTTPGTLAAGTFQINGIDISVSEGDSLEQVVANINGVTSETNVSASIIQVASNDYRIQLKSNDTGVANAFSITDASNVISHISLANTQVALDNQFTFNGITMSRASNDISDVVDNVTFSLYQATPNGTTVTVEVDNSTAGAKDAIVTFVGAYNDFMTFAAKQQERDAATGLYKETAYLGKEPALRTLMDTAVTELSKTVSGLGASAKNQLADIGITFTDFQGDDELPATKNILTIDEATLDSALTADFDGVRDIFEMSFSSSSSKFMIYTRTNALSVTDFSLDVDTGRSAGDQVRVSYTDSNGVVQTINADYTAALVGTGGTITGQEGTVLEGLTLLYAGSGVDTSSISLSQGIGDRLYNFLDDALSDDGLVESSITAIEDREKRTNEEITRLNDQVDVYRNRLLDQYAGLEDAVAKINSVLQLLDAQMQVQYGSQ